MDDPRSDETLMLAYRDGDARAFAALYTRNKGALYRYLLRQCRNGAVAEELFQDIWLNLIRASARYEARARFTTYLFSLAHNRLVDYYRRQAHRLPISYDDDPEHPLLEAQPAPMTTQPDVRMGLSRQAQRLLELLAELPEAQREAFLLREEAGLSLEEIAQATGVGVETAKSRLRYAVNKLRQDLGNEIDD